MPGFRLIDLSHTIRPHWRWKPQIEWQGRHDRGDLFQTTVLHTIVHAYTHVDAPIHLVQGAADITSVDLDCYVGEAAVIDLSHVGPNEAIGAADLEERAGHVGPGDIALLRTDWERKCDIGTEQFWFDSPYLTRDGAEWLLQREIKAAGFDFVPDYVLREDLANPGRPRVAFENTTHDVLLRNGVKLLEYLANLADIPGARTFMLALPLKIEGSDGSPTRAVAIEFER